MFEKQQIAYEKFKQLKVGALFMKMGTGKTKIAIDLVNYNEVDYLLYVCPFSVKGNIYQEIDKWKVNCEYDIVGYETIQSSDGVFVDLVAKLKGKRAFIIADESIFIKNEETKRFQRLLRLRDLCEYALILNGTPLTKNEWDIYNQMYFLSPKIINMNRPMFLDVFFKKITYKRKNEKAKTFYKFSEVNAEYLNKLISPYMFSCDLDFNKEENEIYNYIDCEKTDYVLEKERSLHEYMTYGKAETIINMLANLNVISALAEEKNKAVKEYIKGKRVIVYCNFIEEIKQIAKDIDCFIITGKTKERVNILQNFKNNTKPLLMTYGVGAYSLNLQYCNEIVYSSLNFDYAKIEQSKYRIKRIGQDKNIKYTYFLSSFGVNRLILENLKRKSTLENLIKEKLQKGDLEQWIKNL